LQLDNQFQLELAEAAAAMVKEETLHSELQASHFTWLHTVEDQHRVTDSLDQWVQELTIELELVLEEAVKETGRTHGALAEAVEVLLALDTTED
jgi:hypothetical protein